MKESQKKLLLSLLMIIIPICILVLFFIFSDMKISEIPMWASALVCVAILISPLLFLWQFQRCEKHPSDMNKTSAKPFMRTILYSLFMAVLLAISSIFTRSFAWVLLLCFLPIVVFFFIDDLKRKRKHDTI